MPSTRKRPWSSSIRLGGQYRDEYRLYTATGEAKAEAVGAFLYRAQGPADLPAVGDWVACKPVRPGEAPEQALARLTSELSGNVVAVQGPPGSGKTYQAARMVLELLRQGVGGRGLGDARHLRAG